MNSICFVLQMALTMQAPPDDVQNLIFNRLNQAWKKQDIESVDLEFIQNNKSECGYYYFGDNTFHLKFTDSNQEQSFLISSILENKNIHFHKHKNIEIEENLKTIISAQNSSIQKNNTRDKMWLWGLTGLGVTLASFFIYKNINSNQRPEPVRLKF